MESMQQRYWKFLLLFLTLTPFVNITYLSHQVKAVTYTSDYGIITEYDLIGSPTAIEISGDNAFITLKDGWINVIDISRPKNPSEKQAFPLSGQPTNLFIHGDIVYVAAKAGGLYTLQFNELEQLESLSQITAYGNITDVCAQGDLLYALNDSSVLVFNITETTKPEFLSSHNYPGLLLDIEVSGNYAYVCLNETGLRVLNVTDYNELQNIASTSSMDYPYTDVEVEGTFLYTACGTLLKYHNFTIGEGWDTIGDVGFASKVNALQIQGNVVYVGTESDGIYVVHADLSLNLDIITHSYIGFSCKDLKINGRFLFALDKTDTLRVFCIADVITPEFLMINTLDQITEMTRYGKVFFAGVGGSSLNSYVYPNTTSFGHKDQLTVGGTMVDIKVSGFHLYAACLSEGLRIYEFINGHKLEELNVITTDDNVNGLDIDGDLAIICNGTNGLTFLDLKNPKNPTRLCTYSTSGSAQKVDINGNFAYVTDSLSGLVVLNISDATNPTQIGSVANSGLFADVVNDGNRVYIANNTGGFCIIDVTDKSDPTIISSNKVYELSGGDVNTLEVFGNLLFVAAGTPGSLIYNTSNPVAPLLIGEHSDAEPSDDLTLYGDVLHVSCNNDGLKAIRVLNTGINDVDADGLEYIKEYWYHGTDPSDSDTDGDKINDGQEILDGTDPLDPFSGPEIYKYLPFIVVPIIIIVFIITFIKAIKGKKKPKIIDGLPRDDQK